MKQEIRTFLWIIAVGLIGCLVAFEMMVWVNMATAATPPDNPVKAPATKPATVKCTFPPGIPRDVMTWPIAFQTMVPFAQDGGTAVPGIIRIHMKDEHHVLTVAWGVLTDDRVAVILSMNLETPDGETDWRDENFLNPETEMVRANPDMGQGCRWKRYTPKSTPEQKPGEGPTKE